MFCTQICWDIHGSDTWLRSQPQLRSPFTSAIPGSKEEAERRWDTQSTSVDYSRLQAASWQPGWQVAKAADGWSQFPKSSQLQEKECWFRVRSQADIRVYDKITHRYGASLLGSRLVRTQSTDHIADTYKWLWYGSTILGRDMDKLLRTRRILLCKEFERVISQNWTSKGLTHLSSLLTRLLPEVFTSMATSRWHLPPCPKTPPTSTLAWRWSSGEA